jgi:Hint domain
MATKTWNGTTGDWGIGSNWSSGIVPQPGDIVVLPPTTQVGGYTVTNSSPTAITLNALTIGTNNVADGVNKVTLVLAGASITTTGAINMASYGTIEGAGSLNAGGGFGILAGGSPSILAGTALSGGVLDVAGSINSNITLGFANTSSATTLKLEGSQSLSTIALRASTQTLELNAGSSVTFSNAISAIGGTIKVDGASNSAAAATLTVTNAVKLSSHAELDVNGAVSVSSGISFSDSTIKLIGGSTLTASSGVSLSGTALFSGNGTLKGSINGAGTVSAIGGTLTLQDAVGVTNLVVGAGTTLALTTASSIGVTSLTFTNVSGQTDTFQAVGIYQGSLHIGAIAGFAQGDYIDVKQFAAGDKVSYSGSTVTISAANGGGSQTYTFAAGTNVAQIIAASSTTGLSGGAIKQVLVNGALVDQLSFCLMLGTLVRTPEGEAPVETLQRGTLVLTADGEAKQVVWLGRQTIDSRFADPDRNWPIRIVAGALAENVPCRDLLVSPDHALLVGGILIQAGALVNGTSIRRESQIPEKFVYYHVELDDHSLILAENVPAETFVDNVDRRHFDNWAEHEALYPEGRAIAELPQPRAKARRQVPASIRVALAERAIAIGQSAAA